MTLNDKSKQFHYSPQITFIYIDWLIDWCFTARQHKIGQFVPIYQGGLLAQAFEDSQRGTYINIQLHAIQWTYRCNDKQQVCLTCLKINNAYNKLHDPECVKKNASGRATPSLSIVHNYLSAFTTNKPDPTPCKLITTKRRIYVRKQYTMHRSFKYIWIIAMYSTYFEKHWLSLQLYNNHSNGKLMTDIRKWANSFSRSVEVQMVPTFAMVSNGNECIPDTSTRGRAHTGNTGTRNDEQPR